MSLDPLPKSTSFSHNPGLRQSKKVPMRNINYVYAGYKKSNIVLDEYKPLKLESSSKNLNKKFSNSFNKTESIAPREKFMYRSIQNSSTNNLTLSSIILNSENSFHSIKKLSPDMHLSKKLEQEKDFVKKTDLFLSIFVKSFSSDKNFSVFYKLLSDLFLEMKEDIRIKDMQISTLQSQEKASKDMKFMHEKLLIELDLLKKENNCLKIDFEKIKEENRSLKLKNKRYALLLTQLQKEGIPVEQIYDDLCVPSKPSHTSKALEGSDESEIPVHSKPPVPKLCISTNDTSLQYQEEFMLKFNEFSESWRNQIIKDGHLINK